MVCVRLLLSYNISDTWHYAFMTGHRPSYIERPENSYTNILVFC